ncbi:tryptophan-rich antigen [Plasmodium malariae]|uniref:Tryptophan-rich antigen n=1 Tax=Plasmodium malariae TaxID=5858 RepID=A0A1A8X6P5_PLAMA|nr:tryptophan-rich antigen [Plasmodium malariae]SBT00289.1 tryptophan-rich antigen [Plasmodium malariae]SBT87550.1 tryptophan-rich antigen [Plasmodium malariae]
MTLKIYVSILVLSSLLLNIYFAAEAQTEKKKKNDVKDKPLNKPYSEDLWRNQTKEWKMKEWNNFMEHAEEELKHFDDIINKEIEGWVKDHDISVKEWLEEKEKKWMNFNAQMDSEYKSDLKNKSSSWNEKQWKDWLNGNGKKLLEKDWQEYINNLDSHIANILNANWNKFKVNIIMEWNSLGWKVQEDKRWLKYAIMGPPDPKTPEEKVDAANYNEWRERNESQRKQWFQWITEKERARTKNGSPTFSKWKNNKQSVFNKWVAAFINKLSQEKQWNSWFR